MGRNPDRVFDKTHLSIDQAEERQLIHRDYLAHCLRWSHTIKHLLKNHRYKDATILDVGCGKEMPLAKALYTNKMTPGLYVGVDVNKMDVPEMLKGKKIPVRLWAQTDFCSLEAKDVGMELGPILEGDGTPESEMDYSRPDLITSFEVLEHVTPAYCRKMLEHMRELVEPNHGAVIISTPCFNGSAAGNHINEMTYEALGALLEDLGFNIESHYGTFASISDYVGELGNDETYVEAIPRTSPNDEPAPGNEFYTAKGVFNALREYYDSNLLAILFAPLFPAQSRNCLWHLTVGKEGDGYERKFPKLVDTPGPFSQHADWKQLAGDDAANVPDPVVAQKVAPISNEPSSNDAVADPAE